MKLEYLQASVHFGPPHSMFIDLLMKHAANLKIHLLRDSSTQFSLNLVQLFRFSRSFGNFKRLCRKLLTANREIQVSTYFHWKDVCVIYNGSGLLIIIKRRLVHVFLLGMYILQILILWFPELCK